MRRYGTILIDPPWLYDAQSVRGAITNHYDGVPTEVLATLPVPMLTTRNAHLYLWFTNSFVEDAPRLARGWGFTPKTIITWGKTASSGKIRMGPGWYYRSATEHMLFAVRGKGRLAGMAAPNLYLLPRPKKHSEKPLFFNNLARANSPGPHLELFARRYPPGWDVWGNEVECDIDFKWDGFRARRSVG